MSIILDFLGFTVLLSIPPAVMLYVITGVISGGCKCPNSISVLLIGNDYCVSVYNPPHSDSAADVITAFINLANSNIGPLKSLLSLLPK